MRHAQVRYFHGEHPHDVLLTEAGRMQAAAAAEAGVLLEGDGLVALLAAEAGDLAGLDREGLAGGVVGGAGGLLGGEFRAVSLLVERH